MSTVGVIGAGIAGLSAAYHLQREGLSVQVLEASDRVGGVIQSEETDGFRIEHGPNSIRAGSPALEAVIDDLGLQSERVWANDAVNTRYVVREGQLMALPNSFGSFLSTDLFSVRAKLRLLAEPFIGRSEEGTDESIADFTRRRLGSEVLKYAIAPFVGGIYAASPEDLSVQHAFDRLESLEGEYGSLLLGALGTALRGDSEDENVPTGLFSFREGLETLPAALADTLGDCILRNAPVTALHPEGSHCKVTIEPPDRPARISAFDGLICTVPLHRWTDMELKTPVDIAPLTEVSYPPVSVLALGYPKTAVAHPLDGFGMLVPPSEESFDILGTIFSSTLFPNRAPEDHVLLTTFVGGARAPDLASLDPSALQTLVERDLDRLLGVEGSPTVQHHAHWPKAIPQYTLGYGRVKNTLAELEHRHPQIAFAGNYRQGVSVGDALTSGTEAAHRLTPRLDP